jgi:Ca-activated chloride channel family protein
MSPSRIRPLTTFSLVLLCAAVATVGGITLFGDQIRALSGASVDALAGNDNGRGLPRTQHRNIKSFSVGDDYSGPFTAADFAPSGPPGKNRDRFNFYEPNAMTEADKDNLSTFGVDVDNASYTFSRRSLAEGRLPPEESVRLEEWVNYFKYDDPAPQSGAFAVRFEAAPSPFAPGRHLLRIGLRAKDVPESERKAAHLVFLVDTSGSMQSPDRLPMALDSLRILVDHLSDRDTVALVTYAGEVRDVLSPTRADAVGKLDIRRALDSLQAGGGTSMGDGMVRAYEYALSGVEAGAISRVIVLTDGDANIGRSQPAQVQESVKKYVDRGVTLSAVGFGVGNYHDAMLQTLADKGNGNCYYVDGLGEAKRIFGEQAGGTLEVVAKDVKVQVEFDRRLVRRWRLLGYEKRHLTAEQFRDDKVDAGDMGAGHQVTALYEVELAKVEVGPEGFAPVRAAGFATVRLRAKDPDGEAAQEAEFKVRPEDVKAALVDGSDDLRFAAAVTLAADILRGNREVAGKRLELAREIAAGATAGKPDREEFLVMLDQALKLGGNSRVAAAGP